jgi:hypothetical protein
VLPWHVGNAFACADATACACREQVKDLGSGNFGSPDLTVVMSNPSGINDGLATLIDQRVFMV